MIDNVHAALFERIREKCRQQHWYGPDDENINWVEERYDPTTDRDGSLRARLDARVPQKRGFKYPPATEEQLLATEAALGFPLPPFLRALYAQVANGGFGFGYGLRGAIGGSDGHGTGTIVEQYLTSADTENIYPWCTEKTRLIDLADYAKQWLQVTAESEDKSVRMFRYLVLPYHLWPERFLPICDWGCVTESCLDCTTGLVYRVGVMDEGYDISLQAPSLEDMLQRWLQLPADSLALLRGY